MKKRVLVEKCTDYSPANIAGSLNNFNELFEQTIRPGQTVVLKPNWIAPCHKYKHAEWEAVITHPNFITAVIEKVTDYLNGSGKIIIADGPQTDTKFSQILVRNPVEEWKGISTRTGVEIQIMDLRDHEWTNRGDLIVGRKDLPGDPMGSVEYNLREHSEFIGHQPSVKGYYGADYNTEETNLAHSNGDHLYRISRTIVSADVFINLPKLKAHKKAGITCSLKNLVGINTYKNYLPHHTEGAPSIGGDQFPEGSVRNAAEIVLMGYFRKLLLQNDELNKYLIPVKKLGKKIFGETKDTIRSGSWYGNNTLWRTILDLNKLLMYGEADGTIRESDMKQQKRYLTFVDAVVAGEGNGPEAPDPFSSQLIIGGDNPVSVDCAAAKLIGFDYMKIPVLRNSFLIKHYPVVDFHYDDIVLHSRSIDYYCEALSQIAPDRCFQFRPHFGWAGHIEG